MARSRREFQPGRYSVGQNRPEDYLVDAGLATRMLRMKKRCVTEREDFREFCGWRRAEGR